MSDHNIMKQNLTQRAYLNSITSILDYSSKLITGFIVTPFLISGLGDILFGVWQILGQLSGYTDFADIRASQVLKWAIAKDRDSLPDKELKKYVTATFLLTLFMLPIFLLISVIIIWYSPQITGVGSEYTDTVRITTSLVILSVLIFKLFSIFESILRGMNLGYKRMGFRASIFVAIGFIKILAMRLVVVVFPCVPDIPTTFLSFKIKAPKLAGKEQKFTPKLSISRASGPSLETTLPSI